MLWFDGGGKARDFETARDHAIIRLTGRPVLGSGLRQLALGGLAVAITYGVGTVIGHHAG